MLDFSSITDFIRTLYPGMDRIVLHEPVFAGNEKKYVADCIDSTFVSSVGKYVDRFEEMVAAFVSREAGPRLRGEDSRFEGESVHAIATVNGTAALHLALVAAGVKPGDRVITQPLTFIATVNAIRYAGAEPVFVDVDEDTLGMSPAALRAYLEKVTSDRLPVTAVVPMHTFGNPCRIDEIADICDEYGIPLIEDAAESLGSYYKGQHTGTFGRMGTLSFNGNKTVTTGGGGMILTRDPELARRLKHLSTQAKVPHPWEFRHDATGYNYRLPNINAALGVAQMEYLDKMLASKRMIAEKYQAFFDAKGISAIRGIDGAQPNWWLNGMFLESREQRNEFLQFAIDRGIHCRPAWELMNTLPMYRACECGPVRNAKRVAERLVNVPSSAVL